MLIQSTRQGGVTEAGKASASSGRSSLADNLPKKSTTTEKQPDVNRLHRWALIGRTQQRVASTQGSEQALGQVWNELKRLESLLGQQQGKAVELNGRLQQLENKLTSQDGPLDSSLKPRVLQQEAAPLRYVSDNLDLLTPRSESETLWFSFPVSGTTTEVTLPAGTQEGQIVQQLNQALEKEQIVVSRNSRGNMELVLPESQRRKLDEPVLVRGEGVRLPAGNPVPVRFRQNEGELGQIEQGLSKGEITSERQRIRKLLNEIEQSVRELKQYRQRVMTNLKQVESRVSTPNAGELEQLQEQLSEALHSGYAGTMSGLLAQANVSRQTVVALLT
jgi:predicted transcriptional regulator